MLELYGIKSLLFTSLQLIMKRATALKKFKRSKHNGPCILIVSNVGLYGLNVVCTNIMIIVISDSAVIYY